MKDAIIAALAFCLVFMLTGMDFLVYSALVLVCLMPVYSLYLKWQIKRKKIAEARRLDALFNSLKHNPYYEN